MLYSEFIENTGCKENKYNFEVYLNLEVLHMNSSVSKELIYEYGKKLVDNSLSVEQLLYKVKLQHELADLECDIVRLEDRLNSYKADLESGVSFFTPEHLENLIKCANSMLSYKNRIKSKLERHISEIK